MNPSNASGRHYAGPSSAQTCYRLSHARMQGNNPPKSSCSSPLMLEVDHDWSLICTVAFAALQRQPVWLSTPAAVFVPTQLTTDGLQSGTRLEGLHLILCCCTLC
eukprot:GHUV01045850.1.p2 GENE.GHUV01045850.1~~GHUV01045850.1.p2  ORF type:complete len:105 (-),score=10.15 GHUV01045850.1:311-625(-)